MKLMEGNAVYLDSDKPHGNISQGLRLETSKTGQRPYAVVVACSDSRVIPECIFSAGIGELFVIRTAGNVIDVPQLGSIEYALEHLGTKLVVVLGHTCCGAIAAAVKGATEGFTGSIVKHIREAAGDEKDEYAVCVKNVQHGVRRIVNELGLSEADGNTEVIGAVYHIESGKVEFI